MGEKISGDEFIGIKMFLTRIDKFDYIVRTEMQSKKVAMKSNDSTYQIKRYLPNLQRAPSYREEIQTIKSEMPELTPAPGVRKIRKRRHSEYVPKMRSVATSLPLDDAVMCSAYNLTSSEKNPKNDVWRQEFLQRQEDEMHKIKHQFEFPKSIPIVEVRPRSKDFQQCSSNIAFAIISGRYIFKCIIGSCKYKSMSSSPFLNHLKNRHAGDSIMQLASNCYICNHKFSDQKIEEEFDHTLFHLHENLMLDGLINTLNAKKSRNGNIKTADSVVDGISDIKLKSSEKEMELYEPRILDNEPKEYLDEIERNLMKMFEEEQPQAEKKTSIQILSIETLPAVIDLKPFMPVEPIIRRTSVIVLNENAVKAENDKRVKLEENEKINCETEINIKGLADNTTDHSINTKEKTVEIVKNDLNINEIRTPAENITLTEEIPKKSPEQFLDNNTNRPNPPELIPIQPFMRFNSICVSEIDRAPAESAVITSEHKLCENPKSLVTNKWKPFLHRALSYETGTRKFKPSLSVLRNRTENDKNLISSPVEKIEAPTEITPKKLSSDLIDQILKEEKLCPYKGTPSSDSQKSPTLNTRTESVITFNSSPMKSPERKKLQSFDKTSPRSPNEMKIQAQIEPKALTTETPEHQSTNLKVSSSQSIMKWIHKNVRKNTKFEICYKKMLTKNALIALFKCMSSKCSFTTNDVEIFLKHLTHHDIEDDEDETFYLHCSYCLFKAATIKSLAHHVNDVHGKDIYQCSHCFYRSREKETCYQHLLKSHEELSKIIYQCPGPALSEEGRAKIYDRLIRKRVEFVAPIRCKLCDIKYYLLEDVLTHIENHGTKGDESDRKVVREMMSVLEEVFDKHSYGMLQCLYCVFGTATKMEMSAHLVDHPSEYHFCCIRQPSPHFTDVSPFSINSTLIFKIHSTVPINVVPFEEDDSVLTSDVNFKRTIDRELSKYFSPCNQMASPHCNLEAEKTSSERDATD